MIHGMPWLPGAEPLLILAVVLVAGTGLGFLAQRLRLPGVTGQILAGVLIGPSVLHLFEPGRIDGLEPLTHFALGLIGVTVGAHLNIPRLRNAGRRLFWLLVAEATVTPLLVFGSLFWLADLSPTLSLLLAALAVSTAPATVIALVRETRARGVFVKTLVAAVALDNMACIFLFELGRGVGRMASRQVTLDEGSIAALIGSSALQMLAAALIGGLIGAGTHALTVRMRHSERLTTANALSLLLTYGLASYVDVSPLAACLVLGAVQANLSRDRDRIVDAVFANFEPVILCVFFTLAGMHLSLRHAEAVGFIVVLFVLARTSGKFLAGNLAMRLAGATARVRQNLGLALIPQAGVAVGLVLLIQDDPAFAAVTPIFNAVVLTAVTFNEIVGPVAMRVALGRSGEVGMDRPRLVDFLQEENIVTELEASSMEEVIRQLVDLLIRSHQLRVDRDALVRSVLKREAEVSTCLGEGLAVPHGELPEGHGMLGVMGLSRRGLALDTPDGIPIHCVVLLATPHGERDRHLEVLATLARTVGADPLLQQQLYASRSPAHAYELLHGEETESFNVFLGEPVEG